ncbi:MAG: LamG domain-containing protein [Planctomycetota bacterium]
MKLTLALIGVVLAWPALTVAESVEAGGPRENRPADAMIALALGLRDGSQVRGKTRLETLAIAGAYGELSVPLAQIRSIVVEPLSAKGETWQQVRLEMNNGDKLTGRPKAAKLDVETAYGTLSVPLADVAKIDFAAVPAAATGAATAGGQTLHYTFDADEGAKVTDKSGRGNHGAVRGATWTPNGKVGGAYEFAENRYIDTGCNLSGMGEITVAGWVRPAKDARGASVATQFGSGAQNDVWGLFAQADSSSDLVPPHKAYASVVNAKDERLQLYGRPTGVGQWTHLCFTFKRHGQFVLYQNGVLVAQTAAGDSPLRKRDSTAKVGASLAGDGYWGFGTLDEIVIFDRALSGDEVAAMCGERAAVEQGPVLHLAFDTDEGGKVSDLSGKGNHGTVVGARYTAQGKKGGAYCLSGTNEHITIPNSDSMEIRDQVTLAVWVNLASLGPGGYGNEHGYIINKGDDLWWNPAFCLGYAKSGGPLFHVGNATDPQRGGGKSAVGETKLVPGQWVHLTGTYDGATVKLYVNGHLEREEKYCGQIRSDRAPVHLGGGKLFGVDWGNHFTVHGTIDEVMIFNRALSAEEIRQIHQQPGSSVPVLRTRT